jgi:phosphocarrier protein
VHQAEGIAVVHNRLGMHARACANFVKSASKFTSEIKVGCVGGEEEVDGKSILGMMMLAATPGTKILIKARGEDAHQAVETLVRLVEDGCGEEEDEV